jgi:hypothetical protein
MATDIQKARSHQVDPVLVNLVHEVEQIDGDESSTADKGFINIILTVGGVLIAGELIGKDMWFDQQFGPVEPEESRIEAASVTGGESEESPGPNQFDEPTNAEKEYIHLRNAKFYQSGNVIPGAGNGFFWRGRLAAVDGFMLGSLEVVSRKPNPRMIEINGARIRIE